MKSRLDRVRQQRPLRLLRVVLRWLFWRRQNPYFAVELWEPAVQGSIVGQHSRAHIVVRPRAGVRVGEKVRISTGRASKRMAHLTGCAMMSFSSSVASTWANHPSGGGRNSGTGGKCCGTPIPVYRSAQGAFPQATLKLESLGVTLREIIDAHLTGQQERLAFTPTGKKLPARLGYPTEGRGHEKTIYLAPNIREHIKVAAFPRSMHPEHHADAAQYPRKAAMALNVVDHNLQEVVLMTVRTSNGFEVEETAIALAITSSQSKGDATIITYSQAACRSYARGIISSIAFRLLKQASQLPDVEIVWTLGHESLLSRPLRPAEERQLAASVALPSQARVGALASSRAINIAANSSATQVDISGSDHAAERATMGPWEATRTILLSRKPKTTDKSMAFAIKENKKGREMHPPPRIRTNPARLRWQRHASGEPLPRAAAPRPGGTA
ncbi:hypothetical protein HPB49_018554 [Dermacentor silvarum]|uniref:Uncharacterized protein n=1 Tax=Dermacentor silvarum TaxID=543639 RepID=A0ACB8CYV2_DERSI|nr:hypothetical protein HPB49_018554 [Dermacentor silvarum]